MYSLSEQLLEQYAFTVSEIQKGRGSYICTTEEGKIIIKEYDTSAARAQMLGQVLELAASDGILVDHVVRTKTDEVLATDSDGKKYYVREYIEGRECETRSRDDIFAAIELLAGFHRSVHVYTGEIPQTCRIQPETLLMEYEKHNRELKKVRNYIRGKKSKNEFEMLFMKNVTEFTNKAEQITARLQHQITENEREGWTRYSGICHGDFNQHNVLFTRNGICLTNFENAVYDMYVHDLSNFLRKMMEKHNWNIGLAADILGVYEKTRKLSQIEMEQLYIRLAYPEKFWKIANHYYNSSKSWISGRNIEKLAKVIEQEEQRSHFLRILFNFTTE